MIEDLISNQFAQAGIATALFGSALYQLRGLPSLAWDFFVARFSSAVVLEQHDDLYEEAVHWCLANMRMWRPDSFSVPPSLLSQEEIDAIAGFRDVQSSHERCAPKTIPTGPLSSGRYDWRRSGRLIPVSAFMVGVHDGCFVTVTASRRTFDGFSNGGPSRVDSISIRLWPGGEPRLCALARGWAANRCHTEQQHKSLRIYMHDVTCHDGWSRSNSARARPAKSVVLANGQMEEMLADAQHFFAAEKQYEARGIPHRRGWLLHGPPGNGKSSACLAVATETRRTLHVINLRSVQSDNELSRLMRGAENGIVVIEDVDCTRLSRERKAEDARTGITLSGLLNAIDGVGAGEGRLLILTANTPENLDSALTRPGRVDRSWSVGNAAAEQIERIGRLFGADDATIHEAMFLVGEPMAKVQNHFHAAAVAADRIAK